MLRAGADIGPKNRTPYRRVSKLTGEKRGTEAVPNSNRKMPMSAKHQIQTSKLRSLFRSSQIVAAHGASSGLPVCYAVRGRSRAASYWLAIPTRWATHAADCVFTQSTALRPSLNVCTSSIVPSGHSASTCQCSPSFKTTQNIGARPFTFSLVLDVSQYRSPQRKMAGRGRKEVGIHLQPRPFDRRARFQQGRGRPGRRSLSIGADARSGAGPRAKTGVKLNWQP
jgi:hypothetical protein